MASDTAVNSQITDAVTQANTKILGDAPTSAESDLHQSMTRLIRSSAVDGMSSQQIAATIHRAAKDSGIALLYPVPPTSAPVTDSDVMAYLQRIIDEHTAATKSGESST